MKYLNKFKTKEEYDNYSKSPKADLKRKISLVNSKVVYDNENEPFYIEAIDDIIIDVATMQKYQYSFDTITWNSIADLLNVSAGDKVYLRNKRVNEWAQIHVTGKYNVGGRFVRTSKYNWFPENTFMGETDLISAEKLVLCGGCTSMFANCINLVKGPRIISSKNSPSFYLDNMFEGCTSLSESPILMPGKSYDSNSASYKVRVDKMFLGCTNLKKITYLNDIPTSYHYLWVDNVSPNGLFIAGDWMIDEYLPNGWEFKIYDKTTDSYYIRFKWNDREYNTSKYYDCTSDDNMTWAEWVLSKHNIDRWTVNETNVLNSSGKILMLDDTPVAPTDIVKRIVGSDYGFKTPTKS